MAVATFDWEALCRAAQEIWRAEVLSSTSMKVTDFRVIAGLPSEEDVFVQSIHFIVEVDRWDGKYEYSIKEHFALHDMLMASSPDVFLRTAEIRLREAVRKLIHDLTHQTSTWDEYMHTLEGSK